MHFQRTRKQVADLFAVRGREDKLERSHTDLNASMQVLFVVGPLVLSSQSLFLVHTARLQHLEILVAGRILLELHA